MKKRAKGGAWRRGFRIFLVNLLVLAALLCTVELFFYTAVRHPGILAVCPERVRDIVANMYWALDVRMAQYERWCSRYDPALAYTLRPGSCTFANPEFRTLITVNSRGFRDDEESLDRPAVIVTGDSHAMGWGVEDDETYARLLEKALGASVLNTGVSSYGTVREMKASAPFFSPELKALVIQYSDNDYNENRALAGEERQLVFGREEYEKHVDDNERVGSYTPFQYLRFAWLSIRLHGAYEENRKLAPPAFRQAALFAVSLAPYEKELKDTKLVVMEIGNYAKPTDMTRELARLARKNPSRFPFRNMLVLDLSRELGRDDFFLMDGHLNRKGHEKVAARLEQVLRGPGADRPTEATPPGLR